MASLRRGLPRVRGGEPWPPADAAAPVEDVTSNAPAPEPVTADAVAADVVVSGAVVPDAAAPDVAVPDVVVADVVTPAVLRRGLPRVRGGEPWPDSVAAAPVAPVETAVPLTADAPSTPDPVVASAPVAAPAASVTDAAGATAVVDQASTLRRGLPRVSGGEPWPPAGATPTRHAVASEPAAAVATPAATPAAATTASAAVAPATQAAPVATGETSADITLRRGLPRVGGGDPWPPDGAVHRAPVAAPTEPVAVPAAAVVAAAETAPAPVAVTPAHDVSKPLPFVRTVWVGKSAARTAEDTGPRQLGPLNSWQWFLTVIFGGPVLLILLLLVVTAVRAILAFDGPASFIRTFPGSYELPDWSQPGFPAWAQWQHFFNFFLMASIIKTGLQVRHQKKPPAFWSPRTNPKRKISIALWLHQSLDILWVLNGVIFIVLLFVSGHWVRIVPTSWEVFPNALSAALQYVSLDWPTEHGWANYNSLQQLAYFTTVFIAAPLAVITGVRMSGFWPSEAKALNRLYPVEWARAVHFPVMLYFVLFIVGHVTLVFATGALRNLNHMFGGSDELNWTGFWIFGASLAVTVVGVWAARPLVVAPIAKLFGKVSAR